MNHKENKQTRNYFENFLSLLTTIRNAVLLMLSFFVTAFIIDSFTLTPGWCGCGLPPFLAHKKAVEIESVKTTAYSISEVKKNYDYTEYPFKHIRKWDFWGQPSSYNNTPETFQVPKPQLLRWKSWYNHQSRVHQIMYNR
ncbi:hypothetical protein BKI52_00250 [marine bacterium AO1-C]|nr:hypothetical protein BKI52_00250 [marine bacterium AO1-C]